MYFRSSKKINCEVSLEEPIGKDKDDNEISLIDILENSERNIEDEQMQKFFKILADKTISREDKYNLLYKVK